MSIYNTCAAAHDGDTQLMMKCIANWMETITNREVSSAAPDEASAGADDVKSWLLVIAGAMIFFMQAGFAMVCAGAIRKKNINNTMIKNLLDACGAGIAFFIVGYAIAFGQRESDNDEPTSTFIGGGNFFLVGDVDPAVFFFQFAFSATAATIVAGTLAERCKMASYVAYSVLLTGLVYPVVAHNIWSETGYLSPSNKTPLIGMGVIDFAGSGVVHVTGGITALFATYILGPRRGRFTDKDGIPLKTPGLTKGHSVSLQMLGTMLLWFCWYSFNSGTALLLSVENTGRIAARAAVTTTLSASAGTLSALVTRGYMNQLQTGEFTLDIVAAMNGCLSGLVAVTAGCSVIGYWAAVLIGIVSGWVYNAVDRALIRLQIDDAVSAIPVHLGNGLWGLLAVGLFADPELLFNVYGVDSHPGLFYAQDESNLLPAQIVGALFIIAWSVATMLPFFIALNYLQWFRVNELEEIVGLDATYASPMDDLSDEDSPMNQKLRLAAYRQRFEERLEERHQRNEKKSAQPTKGADVSSPSSHLRTSSSTTPSSDGVSRDDSDVEKASLHC